MIKIDSLTVYYNDNLALDSVSVDIQPQDFVAIIGPNGAGKSTLLKSIMRQIKPVSGSISLPKEHKKIMAYLPQSHQIERNFPISVEEFISAGAWLRTSFWRHFSHKEHTRLHEALRTVKLIGMEKRQISELSGGQFQRMLFARMLMQDASILLLDEPFTAIDSQTVFDLMQVLRDCQKQGKTIIAVVHDLSLVQHYFDKSILMATTLIKAGTTSDVLQPTWLSKAGYQHGCGVIE